MCMVSVVADYGRTISPLNWSRDSFEEYKEILDLVRKIDDKLNQPDCERPDKLKWMADVEARLDKIEKELKGRKSEQRRNSTKLKASSGTRS